MSHFNFFWREIRVHVASLPTPPFLLHPSFLCFVAAPDPMTVRFPEIYGDASRGGRGEGGEGERRRQFPDCTLESGALKENRCHSMNELKNWFELKLHPISNIT